MMKKARETLTSAQKEALKAMKNGDNLLITGEAGTGKSFIIQKFINETKKSVIVTAPTGLAAINIGGATLHRTFKIPLEPLSYKKCHTKKEIETLKKAEVVVIDEVSMCRFDMIEYVFARIKDAEKQYKKSIQIILSGDFHQLPPVVTERDEQALNELWTGFGSGYAFKAPAWKSLKLKVVVMKDIIRQTEKDFIDNLNKARSGDKACVAWFNKNHAKKEQPGIFIVPTNKAAASINEKAAERVPGRFTVFQAEIAGRISAADMPTDEKLKLKRGMRVMSLVNLDESVKNGSLGVVESIAESGAVSVLFDRCVETTEIRPYKWEVCEYVVDKKSGKLDKVTIGTFEQLPLKIAYAVTIHKSQGQTYDSVNVNPGCFAPGQLYVALSRTKSIKTLHLTTTIKPRSLMTSQDVVDFYDEKYSCAQPKDFEIQIDEKKAPVSEPEPEQQEKKSGRGGARPGAGRKPKHGKSKVIAIRVPAELADELSEKLKKWLEKQVKKGLKNE